MVDFITYPFIGFLLDPDYHRFCTVRIPYDSLPEIRAWNLFLPVYFQVSQRLITPVFNDKAGIHYGIFFRTIQLK